MAARLTHPHILPMSSFGEQDGAPYIVMKLVEGGTLAEVLERELLDLRLVARVVFHVASALDYAHSQGVIHRDIKPANILFDLQGNAYLSDFGVARLHEGTEHITGVGGFIGTAAYASPEQCRGEDLGPLSDIYSLGVVLYEMLTGVLPFQGGSPLAIMHKHISEPVPNPLRDRSDLPMGISEIIRKALAKLPVVRYQTAQALSSGLNEALRPVFGTKPLSENAPPMGPNPIFDTPPGGYSLPPLIPDQLLRNVSSTHPAPSPALEQVRQFASATPLPQPSPELLAPPLPAVSHGLTGAEVVLLVLTILAAAAVIGYVLMAY
jgi:serine/threonine protein kinase